MSELLSASGTCLCGAVTITTNELKSSFSACHCGMCRKWGGGPYFAINCGSKVEIEGEKDLSIFDSSKWAERGFCKECGTHLFYRIKETQQYQIPVGFFGDSISPKLGIQYFIDKKPENYQFFNETKVLTEAEIFELFGSKD